MVEATDTASSEGHTEKQKAYCFEMGPIRPPNEGQDRSLLIRATQNCPWNRCAFCATYKGVKFGYRGVLDIKWEVDAAKRISDLLKDSSWRLGLESRVTDSVLRRVVADETMVVATAELSLVSGLVWAPDKLALLVIFTVAE